MMKNIVLIGAILAIAHAGKVDFTDCGNHEIKELDVSGCSGKKCTIHKGKPIEISGEGVVNQDSNNIELQFFGILNGVVIELPSGYEKDGCKYVKCPVHKGQVLSIKTSYVVPTILPSVDATVMAKIIGDHGLGACVKFDVHLVD